MSSASNKLQEQEAILAVTPEYMTHPTPLLDGGRTVYDVANAREVSQGAHCPEHTEYCVILLIPSSSVVSLSYR